MISASVRARVAETTAARRTSSPDRRRSPCRCPSGRVTGNYTSAAGSITLTTGTVTAADVTTTDDVVVGDDLTVNGAATVAETLGVTGVVTPSAGFGGTGPGVPRVIAGAFTLTDIKAGSKTGDAVDSYARLLAEPPPDPVEAATRFLLSALPPLRG